jgi:ribonuclease VapC
MFVSVSEAKAQLTELDRRAEAGDEISLTRPDNATVRLAVDTSALEAIVLNEPTAPMCSLALENAHRLLISAGTVAETLIVAERRNFGAAMLVLVNGLGFEVIPVTAQTATRVANIYYKWGKGIHPASLNFSDCFSYDLTTENECPLLIVGEGATRGAGTAAYLILARKSPGSKDRVGFQPLAFWG